MEMCGMQRGQCQMHQSLQVMLVQYSILNISHYYSMNKAT
jgi:hypothetical protein